MIGMILGAILVMVAIGLVVLAVSRRPPTKEAPTPVAPTPAAAERVLGDERWRCPSCHKWVPGWLAVRVGTDSGVFSGSRLTEGGSGIFDGKARRVSGSIDSFCGVCLGDYPLYPTRTETHLEFIERMDVLRSLARDHE